MKSLNIVWVGCHSEGLPAFASILEKGYSITKFITLNDEAFVKRSAGSREYFDLCKKFNVEISLISTIKNEEAYEIIKESEPDLLIVLGWSEILPERVLNIPTIGTVGAHASMLPHNRGSAPINWALINGDTECGNSLMWLSKEVDQGNIIDQIPIDITMFDTCKTLYDKVADTNKIMLLRLIERLSNDMPTVMDKKNITNEPMLPRRHPNDGNIIWNKTSKAVYDFVRALTHPYPGAFTFLDDTKYFIWNASLLSGECEHDLPGQILGAVYSPEPKACGIEVACAYGEIVINCLEDDYHRVYSGEILASLKLKGVFKNE